MEQYIPKSVVLAEIERKKEEEVNYDDDSKSFASYADHIYYLALDSMQDFIDNLEVKEVDLEREINDYFTTVDLCEGEKITENTFRKIAKHFFELGMQINNI